MNELTREANQREQKGASMIPAWISPALLAVIGLGTAGGYGQLTSLNEHVAETNRLAEMRGRISEAIETLSKEVDLLRVDIANRQTKETADRQVGLINSTLDQTRALAENKVDKTIFSEQMASQRQLITAIATFQERLVTHEQLNLLVGRVDAISRKVGLTVQPSGGVNQ